jgi:uncharacterized protein
MHQGGMSVLWSFHGQTFGHTVSRSAYYSRTEQPSTKVHASTFQLSRPIFLGVVCILFLLTAFLDAQAAPRGPQRLGEQESFQVLQRKHNETTLMILGGNPGTSYFNIAHDMAAVLTKSDGLRVVAMDAPGGIDSLRDLLFLRGVDLAIVPMNVLDYADSSGTFGTSLRDRLAYITALYGEEVHLLAGPGIPRIENLNGKKIAAEDGNAEFIILDLLRRLQIEAEVVKVAAADVIDDVRSGALAALAVVGGKPHRLIAGLPKDGSLHLLALPSSPALGDGYSPSRFGQEDYPALVLGAQTIETVSVNAVLVARNTAPTDESSRRIAKFVPAFFGSLSDLVGPRGHPKWSEVNLAVTLGKWQRFSAARDWLDAALREQSASVQRDFEEFLRVNPAAAPTSPIARKRLFEDYLKWTRGMTEAPR